MERRRAAIATALLGLGVLGVLYVAVRPAAPTAAGFETAEVTRGAVRSVVTATGTVEPRVQVQVGSQVSGRIQALYVDFNSPVTRGQTIARIEPSLFEAEAARARANVVAAEAAVARAEAALTDARLKHERASGLSSKGMGSKADADTAEATYASGRAELASAQASLEQARAALEQAETNLGYTTIVSPIDGIVISRDVDVGQTVAASLQAPTLFTIAEDLRVMEVHTHVAEADVGRLEMGMAVEFGVDAYPAKRFQGVVKEVRYAPEIVQNVVTYDAVVAVENPELELRPGMTAEVLFRVDERPDALLVPNAALRFVPPAETLAAIQPPPAPGGDGAASRVVWVLDGGGAAKPVRIQIGITDGRVTEVAAGELSPGDRVITAVVQAGEETDRRPTFGRFL